MPYNCPQYKPPRMKPRRPKGQGKHYRTAQWQAIRKQIIIRDNATCQMCGKVCVGKDLQVDHKVAKANGGSDAYDNLWILCQRCHAQKGRKEGLGF